MRAVVQSNYGGYQDLELADVAPPTAGADEVVVRVRAASLHPDVWHVVSGRPAALRLMGCGFRRPHNPIPGTDMAGVVEAVGDDVTRFRSGDEVFGETIRTHQWVNGGAYAELVSVPEVFLARKPTNVTFEQAASVPTAGYIALLNLRGGSVLAPGQRVLINGAGGGVGSLALQIAKAHGTHVTAVDGPRKLDMLLTLGADEVLDYTREDFTRRGVRYDFIFDVPGNHPLSRCLRTLEPDGKYVVIGHEGFGASGKPTLGLIPYFLGLIFLSSFVKRLRLGRQTPTREQCMAELARLLEAGKITPIIDRAYPLSEVHVAFAHMIEDELCGRVVLVP